jgi:cytochrome b561
MEKIHLYLFWTFMLLCAGTFTFALWTANNGGPEIPFKIAVTFFVIGFANFLLWAPRVAYRFLSALSN